MTHCSAKRLLLVAALALVAGLAVAEVEPVLPKETDAGALRAARSEVPDSVRLTPEQRASRRISVAPAASGAAGTRLMVPASVQFDPDRVSKVGPRLAAKVVQVMRDLGEHVAAGDTVAVLDSIALGEARTRYVSLSAQYETARAASEREDKLADQQISSEADRLEAHTRLRQASAELDAARMALRLYGLSAKQIVPTGTDRDQPLSRYSLIAPQAGVIERRDLMPGQTLTPEATPIDIVDTTTMWVMMDASEQDIPRLRAGQAVSFRTPVLPERDFSGTIDWIARGLDPTTRTVSVRARVANPDGVLRAGMFGSAFIATDTDGSGVWVAVDAVQRIRGAPVVFTPGTEPGLYHTARVRLGREVDGRVEILQGISAGQPVVTDGAFTLMGTLTAGSRGPDID